MKLVIIGIQGSGKSTQGNMLSKFLHIPYLSTGHIFRTIAKEKTQLGKRVKVLMSSGLLIPDDLTIEIVNDYLSRPEYEHGYILDGFPRTLKQAKKFKNNVDKVIYLQIPDKEALWRLAYREEERNDNTVKAILKRIQLFHDYTHAVINYYEKEEKLVAIDGTQPIGEVNKQILKSLGKQIVKNRVADWKPDDKKIIALVGLPGAGKTEAATYFQKRGLPVIAFNAIVNKHIEKLKLPHTLEVHHKIRQEFRDTYGYEAMARLSKQLIEESFKEYNIITIEGMRSWEEYVYLKKEFPKTRIYILALFADKQKRYQRINVRKTRSELRGEERDIDELLQTHMGPTIAFADYVIKNNFSVEDLHDKLNEVYREIYYS